MVFWFGESAIAPFFKIKRTMIMSIKKIITFAILLSMLAMTSYSASATKVQVFVSFSMPNYLLEQTLKEAASMHISSFINGLHQNSMPKTVKKIMHLTQEVPNLNLSIDPTAFERYGIKHVPALVVEKEGYFDVIYGNLSIKKGIARIVSEGDSGLTTVEAEEIMGG